MSRLYNNFHTSLLAKDPNDPLPSQAFKQPPPIVVAGDDDDEWEVEEIKDVRKRGRGLQVRCS